MDINAFTQIISSFGFPIVACLLMGWYVKDTNDKHREEVAHLNENHKTEMNDIKEALNNNTIAIQQLTTLISTQRG